MILGKVYTFIELLRKGFYKVFITAGLKASFGKCGENVHIFNNCDFKGLKNIYIGNHSSIGPHCLFWTVHAKIEIGNYVLFGPAVTIITGDHRTDLIGTHIIEVNETQKLTQNDADVVIEDGVWIGCNVTILKGVTIGKGCVIGAGSLVTKDTDAYSIYGGVPAKKLAKRFTHKQILQHESILKSKGK